MEATATSNIQLLGAGGFGALIGWYLYMINRYRTGEVQLSDIVTLVGAIGGSAILGLFKQGTDLFGAYGIGLAAGFFSYYLILIVLVSASKNFNMDWFLDGRRKLPDGTVFVPEWGKPISGGVGMNINKENGGNF